MDVKSLAEELRNFEGLKRKRGIGAIAGVLGLETKDGRVEGFGDDTAVLDFGDHVLLFACDGIWEKVVDADPYFAGYSAVLVNVNDVAAMGGKAIAVVNVLSAKDTGTAMKITEGVRDGALRFGVPVVGGHFNPNTTYNGIGIAVIGQAKKDGVIRTSTAQPGDQIVVTVDLDGELHPKYRLAWDSTRGKGAEKIRRNLEILVKLGERKLVRSGRDISNPGIIGTLGMLLEQSGVGGIVDLEKIPSPDGIEFVHWLKVYPGFGFVFTVKEPNVQECIGLFEKEGISAGVVGRVLDSSKLLITYQGKEELVFDFEKEKIAGDGL
jgi:putative methanogenesis marker protein 2